MQMMATTTGTVYKPESVMLLDMPLYVDIAENLTKQMARGALRAGDRVPSLRRLSLQQGVSISTALQAYLWLETRGYLEARPQSGFYVRTPYAKLIPEPEPAPARCAPASRDHASMLTSILESFQDPKAVQFGAGSASPELLPNRRMNLIVRQIVNRNPNHSAQYTFPPGLELLRHQIARRSIERGSGLGPGDVIVTTGAQEAMNLALRATARAGEAVAVEGPTYFGVLGNATATGVKLVEVRTHPQNGMDLNELERAARKHRIKASVVMPNCHNPLGYVLSDDYKRALVDLSARYNFAIIEDDVYGDLIFRGPRPRTVKSFDRKGLVLLCSSYSKVLPPGYRVGWIAAGRFRADVERLKLLTSVGSASLPQMVVAEFLQSGGYDRHLKRLRTCLQAQMEEVRRAIARYFPEGTRISRPAGGYMLWVELPRHIDGVKLARAAMAQHITIVPGPAFSAAGQFSNYIRLNCGHQWSAEHDQALLTLGKLCERCGARSNGSPAASGR
jgi:DNA-binding transcriptional MocR family regulator